MLPPCLVASRLCAWRVCGFRSASGPPRSRPPRSRRQSGVASRRPSLPAVDRRASSSSAASAAPAPDWYNPNVSIRVVQIPLTSRFARAERELDQWATLSASWTYRVDERTGLNLREESAKRNRKAHTSSSSSGVGDARVGSALGGVDDESHERDARGRGPVSAERAPAARVPYGGVVRGVHRDLPQDGRESPRGRRGFGAQGDLSRLGCLQRPTTEAICVSFGEFQRFGRFVALQNTIDRPHPTPSQPFSNTNGILNRYCRWG